MTLSPDALSEPELGAIRHEDPPNQPCCGSALRRQGRSRRTFSSCCSWCCRGMVVSPPRCCPRFPSSPEELNPPPLCPCREAREPGALPGLAAAAQQHVIAAVGALGELRGRRGQPVASLHGARERGVHEGGCPGLDHPLCLRYLRGSQQGGEPPRSPPDGAALPPPPGLGGGESPSPGSPGSVWWLWGGADAGLPRLSWQVTTALGAEGCPVGTTLSGPAFRHPGGCGEENRGPWVGLGVLGSA